MSHITANSPLSAIKGIGPNTQDKLAKLGIHCLFDLLLHLPSRYQDRSRKASIASLRPGDERLIVGTIVQKQIKYGRRRSLLIQLNDGSGIIAIRFFHFSKAQQQQLDNGVILQCFGEVRRGANSLEMVHPEYRRLDDTDTRSADNTTNSLTPIYPSTEGFQQPRWRQVISSALDMLSQAELPDIFSHIEAPTTLSAPLYDALCYIHQPPIDSDIHLLETGQHPSQKRLIIEELIVQQLCQQLIKQRWKHRNAIVVKKQTALERAFLDALPFDLTSAQFKACEEIVADLASGYVMQRILQGDVGSGKTVVAALCLLRCIGNSLQTCLMAPTELLAEQHFETLSNWFSPLGVRLELLVSKVPSSKKQQLLSDIAEGHVQCIVGTHALIQEDVQFKQLAFAVIDEQHRFGVEQRLALVSKSASGTAHQLLMSATPIPRTLAMTCYADLDCSVIDELPPGRKPITTVTIDIRRRDQVVTRIRDACKNGRQVYWVCTLIEESEQLQAQAAESSADMLRQLLPELSIGLVHGRLKSEEKQSMMSSFATGELHILVSTTVIEVGVDVPNASLMIVENAERLGLAQLHQLRGRVGRGAIESHCVLLYQTPLSRNAKQRLHTLRQTQDGFKIAEQDLALRGSGEILGKRQSGDDIFRIANLNRDHHWVPTASRLAKQLIQQAPEMIEPLILRWRPSANEYLKV